MKLRVRIARIATVLVLTAASLALLQPAAQASFHNMKIREVYPGSLTDSTSEFIELQMWNSGQNQVTGHSVFVFDSTGALHPNGTLTFTSNPPNNQNQRTILLATATAQTQFGLTADHLMANSVLAGVGGKICFDTTNVDCVSWGNYSGSTSGVGNPVDPTGITDGQSIERTISPGCTTLLEDSDDTGDSGTDFQNQTSPTPRPNSVAPTETTCGGGGNGGGGGQDNGKPKTTITKPEHKGTYSPKQAKKIEGTATDEKSNISKVEVAIRQKIQGGCKWWSGSAFVKGGCGDYVFLEANGKGNWSYTLSKKPKKSDKAAIKNYTAYAKATDSAGNVENIGQVGQNANRFEVA